MKYVVVAAVSLLVGIGAGVFFERSRAGRVGMRRSVHAVVEAAPDVTELLSVYGMICGDGQVRSQEASAMLAISVIQRRSNETMARVSSVSRNGLHVVRAGGAE